MQNYEQKVSESEYEFLGDSINKFIKTSNIPVNSQQEKQKQLRKIKNERSKRSKALKNKQMEEMHTRIEQLQNSIKYYQQKKYCDNCGKSLKFHTVCVKKNIPQKIFNQQQFRFQQFQEIIQENNKNNRQIFNLKGQIWIIIAIIMIIMGINMHDPNDTHETFSIKNTSINSVLDQFQSKSQQIILDLFYKNESQNDSSSRNKLKVMIEQNEIFSNEQKEELRLKMKYESLILIIEYVKEYLSYASFF